MVLENAVSSKICIIIKHESNRWPGTKCQPMKRIRSNTTHCRWDNFVYSAITEAYRHRDCIDHHARSRGKREIVTKLYTAAQNTCKFEDDAYSLPNNALITANNDKSFSLDNHWRSYRLHYGWRLHKYYRCSKKTIVLNEKYNFEKYNTFHNSYIICRFF